VVRILVVIYLLLLAPIAINANQTQTTSCNEVQVVELVNRLGKSTNVEENVPIFRELAKCPQQAASSLIGNLHVISEKVIKPTEAEQHQEAMHIIWCIRALRYITNGMDFTSKTDYTPEEYEREYRWQFLTAKHGHEVPFFSVWMSRDIVYLAPEDAQVEIIRKWQYWYSAKGTIYHYKPSESIDDWYF
jgi:hypothetical protein